MKKFLFLFGCLILTVSCQSATAAPQFDATQPTASQTAPVPATTTQTFTPIPTPAATATPIPLFFTEEFNADITAWASFQTGGSESATVKIENSFLRMDISSPNTWVYAIHNAHEYSNVFVSAKFTGTPSGSMGLVCNYSEANGWYEFNLASDGSYSVLFGQWLAEGIAQYDPIVTDRSEYLQPENLNYSIGLSCSENSLSLYINEKLFRKLNVENYGLIKGKVGITASSFEETPMIAVFDWVKVNEP